MYTLKVGDRVKILNGCNVGREGVVVNLHEYFVAVDVYKDTHITYNLAYEFNELELIKMQEKKTRTVKKYAVMEDCLRGVRRYYSEDEVLSMNEAAISMNAGISYHIVPTLFVEEEVPVETETRYTFICANGGGEYYPTNRKYKDLSSAKASTANEAIQRLDSSAEEFEIE
jgi:hypothetical protein